MRCAEIKNQTNSVMGRAANKILSCSQALDGIVIVRRIFGPKKYPHKTPIVC